MTKKQRFLTAVRGGTPDVAPVAPLIHCRYAHQVLGRSDWKDVFDVHQMIGSVHHRGPIGVGVGSSLPEGYGREDREIERSPDGRVTTEILIRTPKRVMRGKSVRGMIPDDPLVQNVVEYPVKSPEDWRAYLDLRQHYLANVQAPSFDHLRHVMAVMGGAFDLLIPPIYRHGGTVARLTGDAILAFFGAPISHEDGPERAIRAALEITAGARGTTLCCTKPST